MSDHDQRQYQSMLLSIEQYEQKKAPIGLLISNLEALKDSLQEKDMEWSRIFFKQWAVLEEVYAVMLDKNKKDFDTSGKNLIDRALSELKTIITAKIKP